MSDSSPPPVKPKPGSLRDRIAAFEQKPTPSLPVPSAPRPKPGNLSQWKPSSPSPPDPQPTTTRNDNNSMSASDAKESITKGGSLKERMALLQGLGAFGGGQSATPPPKPAEKPKWKPPPQVTLVPPVTGDDTDDNGVSTSGVDDKSPTSPLKSPSDDIVAALSKPPPPAEEETSQIEGEVPTTTGEEQVDPEEEERQRRAAIAARMARLGGTRVGMGPPIFGRKPEIKPKPSVLSPEVTKAESLAPHSPPVEPALGSERDVEHAQAETDVATNVPLPTSPPVNETALSPQSQNAGQEYFPQETSPSASPSVTPRAMPVPQGPRRAAPPRKKASSKSTAPAEIAAATPPLEKGIPVYDSPVVAAPAPMLGHDEPELGVAVANVDSSLSEPADRKPTPAPGPVSPSSDPRPESLDTPGIGPESSQDLPPPSDTIETSVPRNTQEVEGVVAHEPGEDETAEAAEEDEHEGEDEDEVTHGQRGGFEPLGEQPMHSPPDAIPVEATGTAHESQHAPTDTSAVPYAVFQQGGGADAADGGEDDESDHRAQALSQHALEDESLLEPQGTVDYDDADMRVTHEGVVQHFSQAAESRQPPDNYDESEMYTAPETSSPHSTIHGQYATNEYAAAAQVHLEGEPLQVTPTADDVSNTEMAPPRVTRPLPTAPGPVPVPSTPPPPPPPIPKRMSLPPPARAVPMSTPDSPPFVQGYSPQFTPSGKRTSIPPPSRVIPVPVPESPDVELQRRQSSTRRTSAPPPTRAIPSPYVPGFEPPIVPLPPPRGLGYDEQHQLVALEPEQAEDAPQFRDERISPPTSARKPSFPPPVPDGRRIVESRRSTDVRSSPEERRWSGQYAVQTPPPIPQPSSPPSKKRASPPFSLEKEVIDEDVGDPIDPQFHTPTRTPMSAAIPPTPPSTTSESLSAAQAVYTEGLRHGNDLEGSEGLKRRTTIAERMAKLGTIKFGAPPPTHRMQPPAAAVPVEGAGMEGSTAGSGQPASEEPQEPEEEAEQARRERIAAKIAGMGGMRVGMLPVHSGILPPPPPVPVRREEEVTPRSPPRAIRPPPNQPAALLSESDYAYEHPSSSDDGVQVEAEESEIEEVRHEDLEDEYDVRVATEEEEQAPQRVPSLPPPPPRATRPPIPLARPPIPPPTGRRFSTEAPSTPRSGSFDPVTSVPRPVARQAASDFVMVEAEEVAAQTAFVIARPGVPVRGPPPPRAAPPPPELSDSVGVGGSGIGQWELPSIPSGSLDFGDSIGIANDLSASMWSEDSTAYPPTATNATAPSSAPAPTSILPHSVHPRALVGPPARMTADELRAAWERVGQFVAESASGLLERSKRTLVGNGSYEGFVAEALAQVPNASPPHAPGEYGFLVYAQTGAQVHTRLADIMPGDVVVLRGARLKGHKGLQSYNMSAGESAPCVGVVSDFDAKKVKLKALQANQRVGQTTVESVSYRLEDLKSGTIKVYRVLEV